jgi:hypothetical protein
MVLLVNGAMVFYARAILLPAWEEIRVVVRGEMGGIRWERLSAVLWWGRRRMGEGSIFESGGTE